MKYNASLDEAGTVPARVRMMQPQVIKHGRSRKLPE